MVRSRRGLGAVHHHHPGGRTDGHHRQQRPAGLRRGQRAQRDGGAAGAIRHPRQRQCGRRARRAACALQRTRGPQHAAGHWRRAPAGRRRQQRGRGSGRAGCGWRHRSHGAAQQHAAARPLHAAPGRHGGGLGQQRAGCQRQHFHGGHAGPAAHGIQPRGRQPGRRVDGQRGAGVRRTRAGRGCGRRVHRGAGRHRPEPGAAPAGQYHRQHRAGHVGHAAAARPRA